MKGGRGENVVKAVPIQEVFNLSTQIRARLKKEANGVDLLEELKQKEPRPSSFPSQVHS